MRFEDLFRSPSALRDNFLSRLFGMVSEDAIRIWSRDSRAPYEDLGRPTLRPIGGEGFATIDFALRARTTGLVYVAEQKAELAYENYKYLRLEHSGQILHHEKGRAFAWFLGATRDPIAYVVQIRSKPVPVAGGILVWGAVTPAGRADAIERYGFADVLSIEEVLADLRAWDTGEWRELVEQWQRWSNELWDGLV